MSVQRKTCKKCDGQMTGKHLSYCRECYNEYKRERYLENREKEVSRSRAYNVANREKHRAAMRRYHKTDNARSVRANWIQQNKEIVALYDATKRARRRMKLRDAVCDLTPEQWHNIQERAGWRCYYCRAKSKLTMDHVVPIARGGHHTASNVVPACASCNSRKQARDPASFAKAIGRLFI